MSGADYYKQAIHRALGLLRQGADKDAAKLLQDALDLNLSFDPVRDDSLELAFDPHAEEHPRCWIEDGELRIDEAGWEIDAQFLADLINSVDTNVVSGLPELQLVYEAKQMLRHGISNKKVRRTR